MAKGSQDWVARTDMLLQSLSEIIQRPQLGDVTFIGGSKTATANSLTMLMDVSGAGMHFGSYIWVSSSATQADDYITMIIDNYMITFPTFKELAAGNFVRPVGAEGFITRFDEVNFKYAWNSGAGKTFKSRYAIFYNETHGRTPTVDFKIIFSIF